MDKEKKPKKAEENQARPETKKPFKFPNPREDTLTKIGHFRPVPTGKEE